MCVYILYIYVCVCVCVYIYLSIIYLSIYLYISVCVYLHLWIPVIYQLTCLLSTFFSPCLTPTYRRRENHTSRIFGSFSPCSLISSLGCFTGPSVELVQYRTDHLPTQTSFPPRSPLCQGMGDYNHHPFTRPNQKSFAILSSPHLSAVTTSCHFCSIITLESTSHLHLCSGPPGPENLISGLIHTINSCPVSPFPVLTLLFFLHIFSYANLIILPSSFL